MLLVYFHLFQLQVDIGMSVTVLAIYPYTFHWYIFQTRFSNTYI
jgi:hypothetical protein